MIVGVCILSLGLCGFDWGYWRFRLIVSWNITGIEAALWIIDVYNIGN